MLPRIFYLFILPKRYLWENKVIETAFKTQQQYVSSEIQALELNQQLIDSLKIWVQRFSLFQICRS